MHVTSRPEERAADTRPPRTRALAAPLRPTPPAPPRTLLALAAGAMLAASLAVIGAPAWLSLCLGVAAALRVAVSGTRTIAVRRR